MFVKKTHREWRKLANSLLAKFFEIPPSLEADDVVQVMLLAATRFTFEWQPTRGPSLKTHVVWRACDKALKFIHGELKTGRVGRNAPRSGSPRFALCFSALNWNEERGRAKIQRAATNEFLQYSAIGFSEACADPVVAIFAESRDIKVTTRRVMQDQSLRERYGITSMKTAEKKVMAVVRSRAAEVFA